MTHAQLTLDNVMELQQEATAAGAVQLYDDCELVLLWIESNTARNPKATDAALARVVERMTMDEESRAFDAAEQADCEL